MHTRRLHLLVELSRLGSMREVAETHGLTTSTVSQQLAALAKETGTALLEPEGRRVRLTPAGRRLADHAVRILADVDAARRDLDPGADPTGTVRVTGFATTVPAADADADPRDDGAIEEFAIDPVAQRLGHGSRLLNACVDTLRADRFRRARWWVWAADDVLRRFLVPALAAAISASLKGPAAPPALAARAHDFSDEHTLPGYLEVLLPEYAGGPVHA